MHRDGPPGKPGRYPQVPQGADTGMIYDNNAVLLLMAGLVTLGAWRIVHSIGKQRRPAHRWNPDSNSAG